MDLAYGCVTLRRLTLEDAPALFLAAQPEEVWRLQRVPFGRSEADMKTWVETALKSTDSEPYVVITDGEIVGSTRFYSISEENKTAALGSTFYHPKVWRTALNTHAKVAMLDHAFETRKWNRVHFDVDERNERSQNAVLRLGAKREGALRRNLINWDGYVRTTVLFSILAEEWPENRARLVA